MNKIIVFTLVILSVNLYLYAQSPGISNSTSTVEAPASAASSVSTSTSAVKPTAKKVTGSFVMGAIVNVADLKENGSGAMVDSANTLGINYALNEKMKVGLGHNFGLRAISDSKQLADFNSDNGSKSAYKTFDPTLHFNYAMEPLWGSNPYAILSRYYLPVSQDSRENGSNGVLRTQSYITWTLNPRVDISLYSQLRLYLNSSKNKKAEVGSDSVVRVIVGPNFGYNFNDIINVYYSPTVDLRSTKLLRGQFDADLVNDLSHELGVWLTLNGGKLIINPAWATSSSKLGGTNYTGAGSDANSEYDLNLIATF